MIFENIHSILNLPIKTVLNINSNHYFVVYLLNPYIEDNDLKDKNIDLIILSIANLWKKIIILTFIILNL